MSTIEFNDAQLKCMDFFNNLSSDSKEVCVEMPTGTGKSYMILNRLDSKAITERCVIVFPRLALLLQFRHTYLGKKFPLFYCSATDDVQNDDTEKEAYDKIQEENRKTKMCDTNRDNTIILTTYLSYPRLLEYDLYCNRIHMTLFDEAHHCSADIMSNVLQDCEKKQKCGVIYYFSATPENINRKNAKNFKYSFEDAIRNHLIRSYKVHIIFHTKKDSLLDQVRRINNGQFQKILAFTQYTQHENLPENRHNVNDIVEEWKDDDKGYCVFGLSSDNTPSDDRETIKSFEKSTEENGLLSILVSCRKLGEGIDIKSVNSVMFIDPKKTTKDIYQIIGRGLRLFRDPKTGEPLEWSKQTPCNIILNVSIDISKIDEKNPYGFFLKTGDSEKIFAVNTNVDIEESPVQSLK